MAADATFDPESILRVLNDHGVRYVVVGGLAVAAHGVIRATADVDLVVERSWENAAALAAALDQLDAANPHDPKAAVRDALVRRADRRFKTTYGDVHILHEVGGVPEYKDLIPAFEVALGDVLAPVAKLEDLRAMKTTAGRPKDLIDLTELDELYNPGAG